MINNYLTQEGDMYGVLTNCSKNGVITINKKNSLYCSCFDYYTGVACEINLRPCSQNPCLNNGTCIDDLDNNTFTCNCNETDYYGSRCEHKIDYCFNETCSLRGSCKENTLKQPECTCYSMYEGLKCEIESAKLAVIKTVIRTSPVIAIIILILFYVIIFWLDISEYFMQNN